MDPLLYAREHDLDRAARCVPDGVLARADEVIE
jgi:hypothetical protein